jgi:hypothetical protein
VTAGASEAAAAANTAATDVVAAGAPETGTVDGPEAGATGSAVEAVSETTTVVDGVSSAAERVTVITASGGALDPARAAQALRVVAARPGSAAATVAQRTGTEVGIAHSEPRPAVLGRNGAASRVSPAQAAPPFFPSPDAAELMTAAVADEEFVTQSEETERAPEAGPSGQGWSPGWLPFTGFVLTWFVAVAFVLVAAGATVDRCGSPIAVE